MVNSACLHTECKHQLLTKQSLLLASNVMPIQLPACPQPAPQFREMTFQQQSNHTTAPFPRESEGSTHRESTRLGP